MGVTGLWPILEPAASPVSLSSLEGKILAVDVSLWIHQAVKGSLAHRGNVKNPHLVTLFRRILKLLFYGIRPVVVFDGPHVPPLKRATMANRKLSRDVAAQKLSHIQRRILSKLAKKHAINSVAAFSAVGAEDLPSTSKGVSTIQQSAIDFDLEEQEFHSQSPNFTNEVLEGISETSSEDEADFQSSFDDNCDVDSSELRSLPLEMQRDILLDVAERSKDRRISCASSLPEDALTFSQFQMDRLLQKSKVTQRLQDIHKQLSLDFVRQTNPAVLEKFDPASLKLQVLSYSNSSKCADILVKGKPLGNDSESPSLSDTTPSSTCIPEVNDIKMKWSVVSRDELPIQTTAFVTMDTFPALTSNVVVQSAEDQLAAVVNKAVSREVVMISSPSNLTKSDVDACEQFLPQGSYTSRKYFGIQHIPSLNFKIFGFGDIF